MIQAENEQCGNPEALTSVFQKPGPLSGRQWDPMDSYPTLEDWDLYKVKDPKIQKSRLGKPKNTFGGMGVLGNRGKSPNPFATKMPVRLPEASARAFQRLVNNFNMVVCQLAAHFHTRQSAQSRLFNFTIKNHMLEHVAMDAGVLNPSMVWGYPSEDFLMRVRKLVQASVHGSSPMRCQHVVLVKYTHAIQKELLPGLPLMA